MTAPSVSVVIPARDAARYLGEALDSVSAQTRPPDEVIVVDDGSTDSTAAIAEAAGEPVRCIRRGARGIGAALNAGIDSAGGDLIAFLDADDLWTPRKTELQCAALERDPGLRMVFGHVEQFISPDLSAEQRAHLRPPGPPGPGKMKGSMLIRREGLAEVGPFSESIAVADFVDWYLRAQERDFKETMLPETVLRRRIHSTNTGRTHGGSRAEYARVIAAARRRRRTQE